MRASPRAGIICAAAVLSVAVTACTAPASNVTVSGSKLTVYASAPQQPSDPQLSADVLNAEQLALSQNGSQVGKFNVRLVALNANKVSDNARTAIQDSSAIAYLGEIVPPDSGDSLGITNAQDLLQVTPTDTALELTQSTPAVSGSPNNFYESLSTYGRTFARVVPTTSLEAKAQLQEMESLGVHKLYVTDDGGTYGSAIALAIKQGAPPTISVVQGPPEASKFSASGAGALFVGATSNTTATSLIRGVGGSSPSAKVFVPSALDNSSFAADVATAHVKMYASSPGFLDRDLTPSGRTFVADFTAAYHRAPSTQAIFGYEAMAALLAVLKEAGSSANSRSTVVRDFFALKNRNSVLGTYSINSSGDTSLAPFVFSQMRGNALVPYKFVSVQG